MQFSKEQLKEIEKVFDIMAGKVAGEHAYFINTFTKIKIEKATEHLNKLFDEYVDTFDMYRTISAVASTMQKEL